ncbi:MmgE/PrpD family protein [Bosea sp. CS1GBMeth4]|uniref:MmgE/PrpD family protein n=1 Tax=Bosea sp. CS1GBMeth4 TaxID=1892849 RepID=UPI001644AB8C|nr:MmgE/PrpD family protein [Bosea sp. CS1GBMeth4]
MSNPLVELAQAAARWQSETLPEPIQWAARRAVLDWFATMLPGCPLPPATMLVRALAEERPAGGAVCYVDGGSSSPRHAALLNAVASHIVEFDDIFRDGGYHPGSATVAAALALAQHRGLSAQALHRAIVAGYEVGCRISLAIQPSHYAFWHTTATVGAIGAAVAGAVLLGCDAAGIGHAIALASSFAGGHQQNLQGEGMAKALHPGHAADAGLLAAYAAAAGVTGSPESLHAAKGFAAATSASPGDWSAALDGLGEWTPITRMTVKAHGCCGHIFPALDGLKAMREATPFGPEQIASIHVDGYGATRAMCDRPQAVSAQDARFSIQYCLAAQLVLGGVRLDAFRPEALADPRIRALMPKISVAEDAELAAAYPRRRQARLTVTLADGTRLEHYQGVRKGDPEAPLSDAELIAKFEELAGSVAGPADIAALRKTILESDRLPGRLPLLPSH